MATQIAPSTTSWSRFLSLPGWVKSVMVGWVAAMLLAVGIAVASDSTPKPVLPPAAGASASPSPTADPAKEAAAAAPQKSASPASADVAITSCAVDQVGYSSATCAFMGGADLRGLSDTPARGVLDLCRPMTMISCYVRCARGVCQVQGLMETGIS